MRENIRNDILDMARTLFSQKGYNEVSVKNIADALGISTGNLTYHFRRKEDLAQALIEQQYGLYKKLAVPDTIPKLYDYFAHIIKVQKEHAYYFKHYTQFAQISERIREIQNEVFSDIYNTLTASFQTLYEKGLVCEDVCPNQRKLTVDTIVLLCASSFEHDNINRADCMWNVSLTLLSGEGKRVYSEFANVQVQI